VSSILGDIHEPDFHTISAKGLAGLSIGRLWVKVESVQEVHQRALGAHPEQRKFAEVAFLIDLDSFSPVPRGNLPDGLGSHQPISKAWRALGLTPSACSWGMFSIKRIAASG
jgi:hypothetical protein